MKIASRKMKILRPEELKRTFQRTAIEQPSILEQDRDWQLPQIVIAAIKHDSGYKTGDTKLSTETSTGGYDRATKPATTNPHPNVADTIQEHDATKEYTVMIESRSR